MGLVTLTFDLLTLKLLGLWVLELFAMYATDGRTDGRTKATLYCPFPAGGGIIMSYTAYLSVSAFSVINRIVHV